MFRIGQLMSGFLLALDSHVLNISFHVLPNGVLKHLVYQ